MAALLPCGKRAYPEETVGDEKTFKIYDRACCEDNCPNKGNLFERHKGSACGYALVFEGFKCPIDNSDDEFIWQRWQKMLRNANKDRETGRSYSSPFLTHPPACSLPAMSSILLLTICLLPIWQMTASPQSQATQWSLCRTEVLVASL